MLFHMPIKTQILQIKTFIAFKLSEAIFIMLINVLKLPTIVYIIHCIIYMNFVSNGANVYFRKLSEVCCAMCLNRYDLTTNFQT